MKRKEYSAGAVKLSFWFVEFRKTVELLNKGQSFSQIKSLVLNENLFAAPTTLRANQIFNTVTGRIKSLDGSFIPLFLQSDLSTQKLFALVAAMAYDTLFGILSMRLSGKKFFSESANYRIAMFGSFSRISNNKMKRWQNGLTLL